MRERGIVVNIEGGAADVALLHEESARCHSCSGCGGSCGRARATFHAGAPAGLTVGDEVTLEISTPGPARSALLLMLAPMILFIAGVSLCTWLQERGDLPTGGGWAALAGVGLMTLWYVAVGFYDRRLRNDPAHAPRIVAWPGGSGDAIGQ